MQIAIEKPSVVEDSGSPMYPKECRIRKQTYSGRLTVQLSWWIDGDLQLPIERSMGHVPIMVLFECFINEV
jgi:DNA-directed RNA polymerase beta subunit